MAAFASSTALPLPSSSSPTISSASCPSDRPRTPVMVAGKTIGETVRTNSNFSVLSSLLDACGIDLDSVSPGGATVFAPTNRAFSKLRPAVQDFLHQSPDSTLLRRHVLADKIVTSADLSKLGAGFLDGVFGGPLSFEIAGVATPRIAGARLSPYISEDVCDNGVIHTLEDVIVDVAKLPSITADAPVPVPNLIPKEDLTRARNAAASVSTVGGRKTMGLMKQQPFWMYGPPFNAAKQEEFEPISIAQPESGAYVDYQLMPPGSVIVEPDEVSAKKLNPISGMSKYIGKTKRLVDGDGLSDYSKLD